MGATKEGPNLCQGIAFADLADGQILGGQVGGQSVLLARCGDDLFALGSVCTHYGAAWPVHSLWAIRSVAKPMLDP